MVFKSETHFILIFAGNFLLGLGGALVISRVAGRIGLVDKPESRSSHREPTPRGGGSGILAALIYSAWMLDLDWMIWVPAACLALFSFFDDLFPIPPMVRLLGQFLAAGGFLLAARTPGVTFPDIFILVAWAIFIVGVSNFYNFMDGINGMAGITGVVGFSLLAGFSLLRGNGVQDLSVLAACLAAACAGFLPLNIPRAKIFLGDVGSILLGFTYGFLAFLNTQALADFLVMICFLFPFFADTLTTLWLRWTEGERLFQAHRKHLYQVMANEIGVSHIRVSLVFGCVQLTVGLLALGLYHFFPGWAPLFWLLIFLAVTYSLIARKLRTYASSGRPGPNG